MKCHHCNLVILSKKATKCRNCHRPLDRNNPEVFATTLRDIQGHITRIEKGTRVKVTQQCEINKDCRIDLLEQDNPSRIWNCICGVPMKHLQFDSQNDKDLARRALDSE